MAPSTDMRKPAPTPTREGQPTPERTRRAFVRTLGYVSGGALLADACTCPRTPPETPPRTAPSVLVTSHRTFTDGEWAILVAAVDRMLPRDGDPGALDAGVPEYIDRMLQTPQVQQMRNNFVPGLGAIDRRAQRLFHTPFAAATPAQQDEVLTLFKNSPEKSGEARWYEMLLVLTMEGFLGDPSYGGNKDAVGWKLVGFELVGRNVKADPKPGYDGSKTLNQLTCGSGRGC